MVDASTLRLWSKRELDEKRRISKVVFGPGNDHGAETKEVSQTIRQVPKRKRSKASKISQSPLLWILPMDEKT